MNSPKTQTAHDAMLAALLAWQQWEAEIIRDSECWGGDGSAEWPTITEPHYERLIELQTVRNQAIKLAKEANS
jgi:hypothetical protein